MCFSPCGHCLRSVTVSEREASLETGGSPRSNLGSEVLQSLFFLHWDAPNLCFCILYKKFFNKTSKLCRQTVTKMIHAGVNTNCLAGQTAGKITCHVSVWVIRVLTCCYLFPKVSRKTSSFGFGKAGKVSGCQGFNTRCKQMSCLQHNCKLTSPVRVCLPMPACAPVFDYVRA